MVAVVVVARRFAFSRAAKAQHDAHANNQSSFKNDGQTTVIIHRQRV